MPLSVILAILGVIASLLMTIVCQKRKDLRLILIAYINTTIGVVISAVNDIFTPDGIGHEISRIFFILGSILLFTSIFKEYFQTFHKGDRILFRGVSKMIGGVIITSNLIFTISLEILIISFCLVSAFMSFRLAIKKKAFTNAFLGISLSTVFSALLLTIIESLGVNEMRLYALGMDIIFFNMLLVTAIITLLEQKLKITETDKIYLKDKYSHELGNILHTISLSYELIKIEDQEDNLYEELDELIKKKISEASDLVKFIRSL
ncbi:MAG: hypothetical protein KGD63_07535 [Candidatus Lokiarchaeota archaeon]|nr:hypothetical protein [Candidatus Lokiarchaeota archaeon]